MHKLAKLPEHERRRLIGDFLDTAFGGLGANPGFVGIMRSMTPELPDNPEAEQVEAPRFATAVSTAQGSGTFSCSR
jgi:hypothetical protein